MPEIELKLRGTPARLKSALARLEKKAVKGSAFRKSLNALYYDTAKDDLHAKGLSFRIRDEDGRFVQTLKREGPDGPAVARDEWSDDVATVAPELLKTKSGRKLRHLWKDVRLVPRFRTAVTRDGFLVSPRRGTQVEVVRDLGEIRTLGSDEAEPVSEIELELKAGSPGALYHLALDILRMTPVQIEPRPKSDRGYALLAATKPQAVKAEASEVKGGETLAHALQSSARRHFGQFLANMPSAMQQDPTSIHQMRVAIRRLRSALYAVRDLLPEADYESVRLKLRYLLQSLGDARDWEVLTERIAELEDDQETDAPALKVQDAVNARKRRALAGAVSAVGSRKNTQTLLEAMAWFEDLPAARYGRKLTSKAKDAAARLLTALFNRVRRRGRGYDRLSVADRHRLRIACKNLRYNIELFRGLYGQAKVERFLARLKPVQDDLGHLNDVSRARDLLTELARQSPQKAAIKTVVARLESRVDLADKRARRHVAALRNAAPFW